MVKVLGLQKLVWSIVFFCIQVINFGLLVGSMNYGYWFHQKWTLLLSTQSPLKFEGGLLHSHEEIYFDRSEFEFCNRGDTFKYCYDECTHYCERFKNWNSAGAVYVAFDTLGATVSVGISIILILDLIKFKYLRKYINVYATGFLVILVAFFHFLAFVVWAATVKLKFDDCTHDIDYSDSKSVCGEGGASFAIFIFVWLIVLSPIYFFIARKIRIKELDENTKELSVGT